MASSAILPPNLQEILNEIGSKAYYSYIWGVLVKFLPRTREVSLFDHTESLEHRWGGYLSQLLDKQKICVTLKNLY